MLGTTRKAAVEVASELQFDDCATTLSVVASELQFYAHSSTSDSADSSLVFSAVEEKVQPDPPLILCRSVLIVWIGIGHHRAWVSEEKEPRNGPLRTFPLIGMIAINWSLLRFYADACSRPF